MKKIEVIYEDGYRDGGTTIWQDAEGNRYFKDKRIHTTTPGTVYDRYPSETAAVVLDVTLIEVERFTK